MDEMLDFTNNIYLTVPGELLGALCQQDGGATYASCRTHVLELVQSNLDRQMTDDEASRSEHESTRQLMEKLSAGTRERVR